MGNQKVEQLEAAARIAISQAAAVRRGELRGKLIEASYNAAVEASNRLWEWYSQLNRELDRAIAELRLAGEAKDAE